MTACLAGVVRYGLCFIGTWWVVYMWCCVTSVRPGRRVQTWGNSDNNLRVCFVFSLSSLPFLALFYIQFPHWFEIVFYKIVQNAAARVLTRSRKYDHFTPILQSLHWLPIKFRISYKILLFAYKALNDLAPTYLTNLLSRYNPTRSLRSQNSGLLVVPRIAKSTKGGRTFSYLSPKLWNSLPDNVWGSDTLTLFKSRLKTHLFTQAFI